jgi:uracil-DNA glycosylase family 4
VPPVTAVPADEIHEKYLQKAISEINELGEEITRAAGGAAIPVLGSGHPLADVFLLKHSPQASEAQEGVAFYGRAGQAILKSLQRLRVDPMAVYGTNCVKFAGADLELSGQWLARELRIVEPKLVIVMGDDALEFLNGIGFQLSQPVEAKVGELQRFTPTIEALAVPDIDLSLDEAPAKTAFWNAFKTVGPWWAALPPY